MSSPGSQWWRDYTADPKHGPLPGLLVLLTVLTGVIDAVSILTLGRVFVANMTGNVVFIGFALGGAPGFSLSASLAALAGFLVGAFAGGAIVGHFARHRGELLRNAAAVEFGLITLALVVALVVTAPFTTGQRITLSALSALAMGLQNAVARTLAVPDLTTSVLTMTLTGLAADARKHEWRTIARRLVAVVAMLLGAVVGTVLVRHADVGWALAVVLVILAVVVGVTTRTGRRAHSWQ